MFTKLLSKELSIKMEVSWNYQTILTDCGSNTEISRSEEKYYYNKDHLGSIRQTVKNRENNIVSARDYYAYGSVLREYTNIPQRYKFTEKEHANETNYDPYLTLSPFRGKKQKGVAGVRIIIAWVI